MTHLFSYSVGLVMGAIAGLLLFARVLPVVREAHYKAGMSEGIDSLLLEMHQVGVPTHYFVALKARIDTRLESKKEEAALAAADGEAR